MVKSSLKPRKPEFWTKDVALDSAHGSSFRAPCDLDWAICRQPAEEGICVDEAKESSRSLATGLTSG